MHIMVAVGDKDRPQYMYQWQRVTEVDSIHVPEAEGDRGRPQYMYQRQRVTEVYRLNTCTRGRG